VETLDDLLDSGEAETYDFAFVDADKTGYDAYYDRLMRLVRAGGLMAFDNTLWGGRVIDPDADDEDTAAIRAFNRRLADDERVSLSMVPVADGVTLARRR
jgi:caffeoyl-CoA O-methyltransferase